jgi:hypothetical protein
LFRHAVPDELRLPHDEIPAASPSTASGSFSINDDVAAEQLDTVR